MESLLQYSHVNGLNSIKILNIHGRIVYVNVIVETASLVETSFYSSQVAEQGLASSICHLTIPCIVMF